jgi:acyl carrier protein
MDRKKILLQVQQIFEDILDVQNLEIDEATTANDVEEWDSLTHIQLVVGIEKHFKIKFTSKEILSWENVGKMVDSILSKI